MLLRVTRPVMGLYKPITDGEFLKLLMTVDTNGAIRYEKIWMKNAENL